MCSCCVFAAKAMRRRDNMAWPGHLQGGGWLQPRPPCKGVASCGQAPLQKGGWLRPGPMQGATTRGHDRLHPRPPCKGATGCGQAPCKGRQLTETTAHKGRPPAGVAAARGHDHKG
ncbi:hypothetical protein GW17_00041239 [Ensete ventricosum]|nr:hypothetical protein GW17_00041239 [Ensete ventricosum]